MQKKVLWVCFVLGVAGCGEGDEAAARDAGAPDGEVAAPPDGAEPTGDASPPDAAPPPPDAAPPTETFPKGCPGIYDQSLLPTFEIEVDDWVWSALQNDAVNGPTIAGTGEDPHPTYPLKSFKYRDLTFTDATIRLRGNPLWYTPERMQFQISFNDNNPAGRFLGLRKIALDSGADNKSMLRDRLGLSVLRDMGLAAPCANNARLVVNGAFYGLFTNLEKVDKEFLQRNYGKAYDDGDLWKRKDWVIETNETTYDLDALHAFQHAATPGELCAIVDCGEMLLEIAGEAIISDDDGAWAGQGNYYLYLHPMLGRFLFIPFDLDAIFTRLPYDTDPLTWTKPMRLNWRPYFDLLVADPTWESRYIDAIADALDHYDVATLQMRMDDWFAQIESDVVADPTRRFTEAQFYQAVEDQRAYVELRYEFLRGWLVDK